MDKLGAVRPGAVRPGAGKPGVVRRGVSVKPGDLVSVVVRRVVIVDAPGVRVARPPQQGMRRAVRPPR